MEKELQIKPSSPIRSSTVALSPNEAVLAWALEDNSIQLFQIPDGERIFTITGHSAPITKLRFSRDGQQLFSASHDGWVRT